MGVGVPTPEPQTGWFPSTSGVTGLPLGCHTSSAPSGEAYGRRGNLQVVVGHRWAPRIQVGCVWRLYGKAGVLRAEWAAVTHGLPGCWQPSGACALWPLPGPSFHEELTPWLLTQPSASRSGEVTHKALPGHQSVPHQHEALALRSTSWFVSCDLLAGLTRWFSKVRSLPRGKQNCFLPQCYEKGMTKSIKDDYVQLHLSNQTFWYHGKKEKPN